MMKRLLSISLVLGLGATAGTAAEEDAGAILPRGRQKAPVSYDWFPTRLHAVVWRNWNLVPTERIARAIQATPEQVIALAASMGLPPNRPVDKKYAAHNYKTVLRHNWHLLPYDQLLTLVDLSPEELARRLHEDDFLYIKLGRFKPKCAPVLYREPTEAERRRAAEIAALITEAFGDRLAKPGELRYHFIEYYSRPIEEQPTASAPRSEAPHYLYSYFTVFGDPLLDPSIDAYPERLLAEYAERGVNGVWMHVVLRELAPGGPTFPEWGDGHEQRINNLRKLARRAKKYGIRIYLYMNEPRAVPTEMIADRPQLAGVTQGELTAICTSDPRTLRWLRESLKYVFSEVPELGGVFTITASENLTHCASHGQQEQCPRCRQRSDAEIIAEVNAAIEAGVHAGSPEAKVICWDWGWNGHGYSPKHIALLPDDVMLMSVSEWDLPITRGGVSTKIGEYSISAVGPGPRAKKHWKLAHERGLGTVAKVQVNNTWELAAVPFLPVENLVARHADNLAALDIDGVMLSWSLGGAPSPNIAIFNALLGNPAATPEEVLDRVAAHRYGTGARDEIRQAWSAFSEAFGQFPYAGSVVYRAPQQFGPSNPLSLEEAGYAATMVGFPYDDLDGWRGPYPREVFAQQFEKVAAGWRKGMEHFHEAIAAADPTHREILETDRRIAEAVGIHFASVANQIRFLIARDRLAADPDNQAARQQMLRATRQEIALAKRLYRLTRADSRIGFEASNGYFYMPLDLVEKVINCRWMIERVK